MRTLIWAVCVCVGVVAIGARGDSLALDFTGGGGFVAGSFQNEGWKFSVSTAVTISGLAVFDYGSDGLLQSHEAGLWNADGSVLLASGTVTNSSPLIASTDSLGGWRTVAITPLVLQPGEYVVGANYPFTGNSATEDPFIALGAASNGGTITTVPGITWLETRFTHSPVVTFAYPDQIAPPDTTFDRGFFGANIIVASPLPPTALVGSSLLVGVALWHRARRRCA